MSLSRHIIAAPGLFILAACAVADPLPYAQQETPPPTVIYVSSDFAAKQKPEDIAKMMADASHITPRVKPAAMASVPAYKDKTLPSLTKASVQMPQAEKPVYWNTHIVQAGDTAYSLSRRFCSRTEDIRAYNDLDNQYSLQVGQAVILPRTTC